MSCEAITDFLMSKWRQSFQFFNPRGDGLLAPDDFIQLADYMSMKSGAGPEQASKTREEWMKWFRILQPGPTMKVDEDRYIKVCIDLFTTDLKQTKLLSIETASDVFDRIDLDGDGTISLQEFTIFYEAVGLKDGELARRNFTAIDENGDGLIQRDEFVNDHVRFFTDPNPATGAAFLYACPIEK